MSGAGQLIAVAAQAVPGLHGRLCPADSRSAWHDTPALHGVLRRLARAHPEAGPQYAALRGWGLLVWQPIYLGVLCTHLTDMQPDLDRLSLEVTDGEIGGYRLGEHAPRRADEAARLQSTAAQLAAGLDRLLPAWQAHAPLHAKAARRTSADCALAALLAVRRQRGWPPSRTREAGSQWLTALGLQGESGYLTWHTPSGEETLALAHRVCCLHFRRRGSERCSTCPKRTLQERVTCLQREWSTEGAV